MLLPSAPPGFGAPGFGAAAPGLAPGRACCAWSPESCWFGAGVGVGVTAERAAGLAAGASVDFAAGFAAGFAAAPGFGPGVEGRAAGRAAPGFGAFEPEAGLGAPGFGAEPFDSDAAGAADSAEPPASARRFSSSRSRRATGGSTLDEAVLTNSPISCRVASATLDSTPISAAISCTRGFATVLLIRGSTPRVGADQLAVVPHREPLMIGP
jgi:hypothetical protein